MEKRVRKGEKGGKMEKGRKKSNWLNYIKIVYQKKNVVTLNKTTGQIYVTNKNIWN